MKPKKTRQAMTRRLPLVSPAPPAFDPQMWFNPDARLDPSQVLDSRGGVGKKELGFRPLGPYVFNDPVKKPNSWNRKKGGKSYGR